MADDRKAGAGAPATPTFPSTLLPLDVRSTPVLQTDVLVIGAGLAGTAAALAAADHGADVLMVSKTGTHETNTAWAQGGVAAALTPEDSLELHVADTLRVGSGIADPNVARRIVERGPASVSWLTELGAKFDRREDGSLALGREGGHSVHRVVHNGDATGAEIQRVLDVAFGGHPRIRHKQDAFVRDLVVQDERCVGAVLRVADEYDLAVHAGAVVIASGGAGQMFRETTNPIGAGGDGTAQCFRAGALLADMEFVQFHPTTLYIAGASRFLISEVVRGAGAVLRDRDGVAFMDGIHELRDLAPRDVVSRAILRRMVETNDTHVYLDLTDVDADPHVAFPSISRICAGFDIDIARDRVPVRPGAHYQIGGVRTDDAGRTSIRGLFAAGEVAATYLHGANRLASNSLLEACVLGLEAGATAANDAELVPLAATRPEVAQAGPRPRIHLDDMLYSLKSLMWRQVGLLRDAEGLSEAIDRIALWSHYLHRAGNRSRRAFELTNMLTVSALCATSALARRESRGTHFRTDHDERDDDAFCRHSLVRRAEDGTIDLAFDDVLVATDA